MWVQQNDLLQVLQATTLLVVIRDADIEFSEECPFSRHCQAESIAIAEAPIVGEFDEPQLLQAVLFVLQFLANVVPQAA